MSEIMNKKEGLFLLHLPPPVHGSSMVGGWIRESDLLNSKFNCRYINLLASTEVSQSGKVTFKKLYSMILTLVTLLKLLFLKKPDFCYLALTTTGIGFYRDSLFVLILRIFRVKRVYHLHNKGVQIAANNMLNTFLYRFVFEKAKVIILSKLLYKDISKFVHFSNVYICPNGIPKLDVDFEISSLARKEINILFLSNLIESKGVILLLEACSNLLKLNYKFKCIFIGGEGDISEESFLSQVRRLNLEGVVSYEGRKYGHDKEKYFLKSDIFVFPTKYKNETFGLVNLEAMQYSLPIISTFEGGIPDVIEDGKTGFLIQPNVDELTDKISYLIDNKSVRCVMGEEGRKRYLEFFTLDHFEKNITNIIDTI